MKLVRQSTDAAFKDFSTALGSSATIADTGITRLFGILGINGKAFASSFYVALPAAFISLALRWLAWAGELSYLEEDHERFLQIPAIAWSSITGFLGFLVVFRAQMAYGRYWQALTSVHLMRAEWFESCSALTSFCSRSPDQAAIERVRHFKHLIVRLFSLCHAGALLKLIEKGVDDTETSMIPVVDPDILDKSSINSFWATDMKVEMVSQWIQHLIVKALDEQVLAVPPPIATRSFQELANGIVKYHDAVKVKTIPFPVQYQEVCDVLLGIHWLMTPALIALWINSPILSFLFTFLLIFTLWSLARVCSAIENPFNMRSFVKSSIEMQHEFNLQLLLMLDSRVTRIPKLAGMSQDDLLNAQVAEVTLHDFWSHEHANDSSDTHLFTSAWEPLPAIAPKVLIKALTESLSDSTWPLNEDVPPGKAPRADSSASLKSGGSAASRIRDQAAAEGDPSPPCRNDVGSTMPADSFGNAGRVHDYITDDLQHARGHSL